MLPMLVGIILLFIQPYNRYFAYNLLKDDCYNHGSWMYDRIFSNPNPVDVAFFGSSRTIHAVHETKVETSFYQTNNYPINIVNLGYCRLGRNLQYVILKDILKTKSPKLIVLEVREREDKNSHPVFPYLANNIEVLNPVVFYNRDIIQDMYLGLISRLEYFRETILGNIVKDSIPNMDNYGYGFSSDTADFNQLEKTRLKSQVRYDLVNMGKPSNFSYRFPRKYIEKISQLAQDNNVNLAFFYNPSYGMPLDKPLEYSFYEQFGEVWIPPIEIINNPNNWMDPEHLNNNGADELKKFIATKIMDQINKSEAADISN